MDGWIDGWTGGWVGGWMDGYIQPRNRYIFHFWHRVNQNEIMKKRMLYTNQNMKNILM